MNRAGRPGTSPRPARARRRPGSATSRWQLQAPLLDRRASGERARHGPNELGQRERRLRRRSALLPKQLARQRTRGRACSGSSTTVARQCERGGRGVRGRPLRPGRATARAAAAGRPAPLPRASRAQQHARRRTLRCREPPCTQSSELPPRGERPDGRLEASGRARPSLSAAPSTPARAAESAHAATAPRTGSRPRADTCAGSARRRAPATRRPP